MTVTPDDTLEIGCNNGHTLISLMDWKFICGRVCSAPVNFPNSASGYMRVSDFQYELPDELIAQHPLEERTASRMMVLDRDVHTIDESPFSVFVDYLRAGDVLVMNNTRVIPARLYGRKTSGGKIEILLERIIDERSLLAQVRVSKKPKAGTKLLIDNSVGDEYLEVLGRQGEFFELGIHNVTNIDKWLARVGHLPLPPYIQRSDHEYDNPVDKERYQTVYAEHVGAVAAPTAGLHFDQPLLAAIRARGVSIEYVTLHVGAGTFQPVRVDNIGDHQMHYERFEVSAEVASSVNKAKKSGGRVIAVGTTSVRALESAANLSTDDELVACTGDTNIFITPGYEFCTIDTLLTNFHLPGSTLMMLVSAFAGYDFTMQAYKKAVQNKFRFFSFGDAMLIT
ncbi:MAG: tRNA preQ1(34) S-adenosylmethionine ribosyltransferase-isomerase QueA [Arenicellaceae bacterium]|nr:tRNA preQ1(34) S-adenosylmethionine ribosyltransferase-isomerase QueA [Arenicellaceae bacterium]